MENKSKKKGGFTTMEFIYGVVTTFGLLWVGWISSTTFDNSKQIGINTAAIGDLPSIAQDSKEAKIQAGIAAGIVKELARSGGVPNSRIQSIEQKVRDDDDKQSSSTSSTIRSENNPTINVSSAF